MTSQLKQQLDQMGVEDLQQVRKVIDQRIASIMCDRNEERICEHCEVPLKDFEKLVCTECAAEIKGQYPDPQPNTFRTY